MDTISSESGALIAHYDPLTTLPNRLLFNELLNKAINHCKRRQAILAVLMLEIDTFDTLYSTIGKEMSDAMLKEVAKRITKIVRTEDLVARLEGDTFIILLNDIGKPKFASSVAEKLLYTCALPMKINTREFHLTASIGISIYPHDSQSLEEILDNVDKVLYKAKTAGGNRYQFHTEEMDKEAREYIQLGADLRKAIHNKEFVLYYQPKLHIKQGKINGLEALLRWAHPKLGLLNPAKFIPLAEDIGLIMEMGEFALREACQMNKYWQGEGYEHLTVSLNLSPKQFYHPDMPSLIEKILKETELNPNYLELEINESTVMADIEKAMACLKNIKEMGVQLSIDHFGVGYTSISHLKQFPISAIKIDSSFIKGAPNNPNDSAITNAFIVLAHSLGFEVVAEGVETAEQLQYLTAQQCDMVQGYFLSYPLPAAKIALQFKKLMESVLI